MFFKWTRDESEREREKIIYVYPIAASEQFVLGAGALPCAPQFFLRRN